MHSLANITSDKIKGDKMGGPRA